LLTSAIIARLLSRGPDSLSESRKRGCVVATAEKSEQRLPVFSFAVFLGVYSNFYVLPTHYVIFWLFWGVLLANICNYRPLAVTRPSFAVRIKKKGLLDGNSGEILTALVVLF